MADELPQTGEQDLGIIPVPLPPTEPAEHMQPEDVIINPGSGGFSASTQGLTFVQPKAGEQTSATASATTPVSLPVPPTIDPPTSLETKTGENQGGEVVLNRVNTYQDAIKEALRTQSMSSASLLMAEDRRRQEIEKTEANESLKTPKNRFLLIGAGALVLIGLFILGFAFLSRDDNTINNDPRSIITKKFFEPNGIIEIAGAQLSRNTILKVQQVMAGPMPRNEIQQIVITKERVKDPDATYVSLEAVPYTSDELLSMIQARIDSSFNRSIDQTFFLGVHASAANETFLVFRITNFDTVFAAMFAWENAMIRDLEAIFPVALAPFNKPAPAPVAPAVVATSTATSSTTGAGSTQTGTTDTAGGVETQTPPVPQRTTAGLFADQVLVNGDARVLKDGNGNVVFFYTFIDEEYVYFGTKPATLNEVKKRIRSAKLLI
jgi:hypothetical protein